MILALLTTPLEVNAARPEAMNSHDAACERLVRPDAEAIRLIRQSDGRLAPRISRAHDQLPAMRARSRPMRPGGRNGTRNLS